MWIRQRRIPEERNPRQHLCENLRTRPILMLFTLIDCYNELEVDCTVHARP